MRKWAEETVKKYDKNGDSGLDAEEVKAMSRPPKDADKDSDGKITVDELVAASTRK
jgi:hypothetical protein